jgi:hypothetical protein
MGDPYPGKCSAGGRRLFRGARPAFDCFKLTRPSDNAMYLRDLDDQGVITNRLAQALISIWQAFSWIGSMRNPAGKKPPRGLKESARGQPTLSGLRHLQTREAWTV